MTPLKGELFVTLLEESVGIEVTPLKGELLPEVTE